MKKPTTLCIAKTRSRYEIKPLITSLKNKNDAFKKINRNRRDRDIDYIDWLDSAHRSTSAIFKFEKFVKDKLGYLATSNPSMADVLVMTRSGSNKLIFLLFSEYFLGLADRLTK